MARRWKRSLLLATLGGATAMAVGVWVVSPNRVIHALETRLGLRVSRYHMLALGVPETSGGWQKATQNPVLGGDLGVCFDAVVVKERDQFRMWFSWRPRKSIGVTSSPDGVHWAKPVVALGPNVDSGWEAEVNRPDVIERDGVYHMWYTGQLAERSQIGHATSPDGVTWQRLSTHAELVPDQAWEKAAVMCPDVLWDQTRQQYRMWYSGGDQYEPDAIGYASSTDGSRWTKLANNPIFKADPTAAWEQHKVTACQVVPYEGEFLMFYIGFANEHDAQIGMARSHDGISEWRRFDGNPIVRPGNHASDWDYDAVYKPSALLDKGTWYLWFNGRRAAIEQIGMATHAGAKIWPEDDRLKPSK